MFGLGKFKMTLNWPMLIVERISASSNTATLTISVDELRIEKSHDFVDLVVLLLISSNSITLQIRTKVEME